MVPSHRILACFLLVISACTNAVDPNDPRVSIQEISTQFPGFESDIVYIEDGLITLIDGQSGAKRTFQKTIGTGKLDYLRTAGDGRHVYYIQFSSSNRSGPLVQLDLVTGVETIAYEQDISSFTVYHDRNILIPRSIQDCELIWGCSDRVMINLNSRREMSLESAIEAANAEWGVAIHQTLSSTRSGNDLVIRQNFWDEVENISKSVFVRFLVNDGQLEPISIDTLVNDNRVFGSTGKFAVGQRKQLYLDRLDTGTSSIIDKDTTYYIKYAFSAEDEYVVVKKPRSYSKEFHSYDGYHIYNVRTGRYFHLFNKAMGINAFHFSPNRKSVIFLAQFKDDQRWHLVTTKIDGSNPVLLSTLYSVSEMPRFISVSDDAL